MPGHATLAWLLSVFGRIMLYLDRRIDRDDYSVPSGYPA